MVTGSFISINPGAVVEMDLKQYNKRKFAVDIVKEATEDKPGLFNVTSSFHFKTGEKFGFEGEIDKRSAESVVEESLFEEIEAEQEQQEVEPEPEKEEPEPEKGKKGAPFKTYNKRK